MGSTEVGAAPGEPSLHLAVALDGAGWHPAAWREPAAPAGAALFTADHWVDTVRRAQSGLLDYVTIADSFGLPQDPRAGDDRAGRPSEPVLGRLDAVLVAARVAPLTSGIGLVPTATATHTEPFHLSKAIATLDYVSTGRAGIDIRVAGGAAEAALFGRRGPAADVDLLEEAADYVEVMRRLWDSWEDDAEIRDAATGRFVDREKLHYIDFVGRRFSVKGPSITPRPPQGQPLVTASADGDAGFRFAASAADVVHVAPRDAEQAQEIVAAMHEQQAAAGRPGRVQVFADIAVVLDDARTTGAERKDRLDTLAGREPEVAGTLFTGSAAALADLLQDWLGAGVDGFRLLPATVAVDLRAITDTVVPELQRRGIFRGGYGSASLRGLLGLSRPAGRYAAAR